MPLDANMTFNRPNLDPASFPLSGTRLIEASAGTGKTYQIANLYVRLVLGSDNVNKEPLPVEKILVVTFTNAATDELRGRIRTRLEEVLHIFRESEVEEHDDDFINKIRPKSSEERIRFIKLLNDAILSMDEASISTIHSFAVQAARTFLFETGALAEIEISESSRDFRTQRISDLYRDISFRFSKSAPAFFALIPCQDFKAFVKFYSGAIPSKFDMIPAGCEKSLDELCNEFMLKKQALDENHRALASTWRQHFPEHQLDDDGSTDGEIWTLLNKKLKENFEKSEQTGWGTNPMDKSLVKFLIKQMALNHAAYEDKQSTRYYKKWLGIPEKDYEHEPILSLLQEMRKQIISFYNFDQEEIKRKVKARIFQKLVLSERVIALDQMSLDDVIQLINQKLEKGTHTREDLQRIITQTYPACLVDEFQDTDPEQFRMFNEIYSEGAEGTGFFMIGDPKQSIYAFRGADIFSYLDVRAKVNASQSQDDPRIYSLDTNWRSKSRLVRAVNALFKEHKPSDETQESKSAVQAQSQPTPVFLFKGIEYRDVESCEDEPHSVIKPTLKISDREASPLVFVGNPETAEPNKIRKEILRRKYARDTAARIKSLLDPETGACLEKVDKETGSKSVEPIKPQDIAVLVRSGTEARTVREELGRKEIGIRCVYLSQKDSVFSDSEFSEDLYHVLLAINEHFDKRRLKTALATPLLRGFEFDFNAVDEIENSDTVLESLIEEFGEYKELWKEFGIMAALNRLLANDKRGLFTKIARRDDSDRIITDFRHLADLLQTQDQEFGSAEQLIDWYAKQLDDDSSLDEDSKRIRLESDEDLVKIVTIHVSKGLQYPIVFLPFFYMPWKVDLKKNIPLYHELETDEGIEKLRAVVDFSSEDEVVKEKMQKESLAEDMRLLYVAITRAIYQCYIGISDSTSGRGKAGVFDQTVWGHLLDIAENQGPRKEWPVIEQALHSRIDDSSFKESDPVMTTTLIDGLDGKDSKKKDVDSGSAIVAPEDITLPRSNWQITSYSSLAHGRKVSADDKGDDEQVISVTSEGETDEQELREDDKTWANNPRYTLKGSAITGNCLHNIFEIYALEPSEDIDAITEKLLSAFGLDKPAVKKIDAKDKSPDELRQEHINGIQTWIKQVLNQPLACDASESGPSLIELFQSRQVLPEMDFDFVIGSESRAPRVASFNKALQHGGIDGLNLFDDQIHGLMTGSADLVFIHESKVYVLDYKSNTLGKAPRFYDQDSMTNCMTESRYDLQYMIYSAAVHRYFSRYFTDRYAFDKEVGKDLSFGGVFYLFLRGMGLEGEEHRRHGVWFKRPEHEHIRALDDAFRGDSR